MECNEKVTYRKPMRLRILPVLSVCIFLGVWQICVGPADSTDWRIPSTLLSSPYDILSLMFDKLTNPAPDGAVLMEHAWTSMQEAFLGYVLALIVGLPLGLAMGWFTTVRGLVRPIFERVLPS